jgi:hypothetical protein
MTKLACTSETAIMLSFVVMNLKRWLSTVLFFIFQRAAWYLPGVQFAPR